MVIPRSSPAYLIAHSTVYRVLDNPLVPSPDPRLNDQNCSLRALRVVERLVDRLVEPLLDPLQLLPRPPPGEPASQSPKPSP